MDAFGVRKSYRSVSRKVLREIGSNGSTVEYSRAKRKAKKRR